METSEHPNQTEFVHINTRNRPYTANVNKNENNFICRNTKENGKKHINNLIPMKPIEREPQNI